jgi:hypothetical protein
VRVTRQHIRAETPRRAPSDRSLLILGALVGLGVLLGLGLATDRLALAGVTALPRRIWSQATRLLAPDAVPDLQVDIAFEDYQRLLTMREAALEVGFVERAGMDDAEARLSIGDRQADVMLAFPEGPVELLRREGGWPLVGYAREGADWIGGREFALSPADAETFQVAGYLAALRRAGLPATELHLVQVWVNGDRWGLYALERLYDADAQRADTSVLSFDPGAYFEAYAALGEGLVGDGFSYARPMTTRRMGLPRMPQTELFEDDPELAARHAGAIARLDAVASERLRPAAAFDPEAMGRFLALTTLWRGKPTLNWLELSLLYDAQRGTFTPIGSRDGTAPAVTVLPDAYRDDPEIQRAYLLALQEIADPGYLAGVRGALEARWAAEAWSLSGAGAFDAAWAALTRHHAQIQRMLEPARTLYADADEADGTLILRLRPTQRFPVEIIGFDVGGAFLPVDTLWIRPETVSGLVPTADRSVVLAGFTGAMAPSVELRIPLTAMPVAMEGRRDEIRVLTRLWGLDDQELVMPVREAYPLISGAP